MSASLSIFIITKNEFDRLERTIAAVRDLSDDIVVIDSGSSDGTIELAQSLGARVIYNPWPGYGAQKRFGEDQCRHAWMLNIDADEVVTHELKEAIRSALSTDNQAPCAFKTDIIEMFPGEIHPHPWAFRISPVRLYHRDIGRYNTSPVHDRVDILPGTTVHHLAGMIEHRSVRSLGDELIKLNAYSDSQADDIDEKGRTFSALRLILEFPLAFLKAYVTRRHCVRGLYGFMTAMNYAFFRYLRLAKYWERRLGRRA
ncbi:glycosyltransferase family 2 protein [Candidatus Phycosocius spiralis]|uniref:Glycosyltransferase RP128 n=1 Tax=Candidatus Phycosocius spiralis TaxID=2815099 RepID=A0ABQ4PVY8_9PROT|nr:glycosyltransferase family 2 protein [Candidatus Phycosocius spiralis]GIU67111.1 putative glycosyltransferase RP128 [Candidatus Phycosocius spiralis]